MHINIFLSKMRAAGDAYVYYISPVSGKEKYHIATMELDNNKYILDKNRGRTAVEKEGYIRMFCWDLDDFKNVEVSSVTNIVPLSYYLNN